MKRNLPLILLLLVVSINIQAQVFGKVFEADSLKEIIANHKIVAVIPFNY